MNALYTWLLVGLSASLLGISFLFDDLAFVSFFSFLPLFEAINQLSKQRRSSGILFLHILLFYFIWQCIAGSWMAHFGWGKVGLVVFINSLLFSLFQIPTLLLLNNKKASLSHLLLAFIAGWLCFDQVHLDWAFSFPVLNLGTNLVAYPWLVQWYDILGIHGGTLWCLSINYFLFQTVNPIRFTPRKFSLNFHTAGLIIALTLPVMASLWKWNTPSFDNNRSLRVTALHPNLNCYTERKQLSPQEAIAYYFSIMDSIPDKETIDLILWPENALNNLGWNSELNSPSSNEQVRHIRQSLESFPNATLLTGAITFERPNNTTPIQYLNYSELLNINYLANNSIVAFSQHSNQLIRTKKQLVPFEEVIPTNFGQYVNSLIREGIQVSGIKMFFAPNPKWENKVYQPQSEVYRSAIPLICYESAFPNLVAQLNRKHSPDFFTVHLNEGWYDHELGARLFEKSAQARAIENRKAVIRSSNRGISDFIDPMGRIQDALNQKAPAYLMADLPLSNKPTLFMEVFQSLIEGLLYLFFIVTSLCSLLLFLQQSNAKPKKSIPKKIITQPKKRRTIINAN